MNWEKQIEETKLPVRAKRALLRCESMPYILWEHL